MMFFSVAPHHPSTTTTMTDSSARPTIILPQFNTGAHPTTPCSHSNYPKNNNIILLPFNVDTIRPSVFPPSQSLLLMLIFRLQLQCSWLPILTILPHSLMPMPTTLPRSLLHHLITIILQCSLLLMPTTLPHSLLPQFIILRRSLPLIQPRSSLLPHLCNSLHLVTPAGAAKSETLCLMAHQLNYLNSVHFRDISYTAAEVLLPGNPFDRNRLHSAPAKRRS